MRLKFNMFINRASLLHLRIPFSLFLAPVFFIAVYFLGPEWSTDTLLLFFCFHLFLYPASNAYNSYCDQDTESIGGLKSPPPATLDVFKISILFDGIGFLLAFYLSPLLALMYIIYSLVSRAYSYPKIRLKKYPLVSSLVVAFFQGAFIYFACAIYWTKQITISDFWIGIASSLLILSAYPLSQIYQYEEDKKRGDTTLSMLLGKTKSFLLFFALQALFLIILFTQMPLEDFKDLMIALSPALVFAVIWFLKQKSQDKSRLFDWLHRFQYLGALLMIVFFITKL